MGAAGAGGEVRQERLHHRDAGGSRDVPAGRREGDAAARGPRRDLQCGVRRADRERGADAAATDPKCWSAQLGFTDQPQREGEEDLHVVAIVEDTLLIDMTLNQASAPEHGVVLTPGFFPIPGEFSKGGEAGKFTSYVNGSAVTYVAHPDEKAYLSMPHWTNRTEYEPFVKSALARLESS